MEIGSVNSTSDVEFVDPQSQGFSGLTADDFFLLFITELQNQDPSEPLKNGDLLNQLSAMSNITAQTELSKSFESFTQNQKLSSAASLIGKSITGISVTDQPVTGIVEKAFLKGGEAFVGVGNSQLSLDLISEVNNPPAPADSDT